ncbi:MAG: hypothetical protein J6Y74_03105 [Clostridia bacterium]|nr:hypothetical protein [Clostridia bacterium]
MRKNRFSFALILLLVLSLALSLVLFTACKKKPEEPEDPNGDVIAVSTAMSVVQNALLSMDGSKDQNVFFLSTAARYTEGADVYDLAIRGAFDITAANIEEDTRTEFLLELKKETTSVFRVYYREGDLYIDYPPYLNRVKISDVELAKTVSELYFEKENGALKSVIDLIPTIGSRIFGGCKYYANSETGESRYVFTLSYALLFDSLAELLESADIGLSAEECISALHLTNAAVAALREEGSASVEFSLQDGAFVSAKAESASKAIEWTSFSLSRNAVTMDLPTSFENYKDGNLRNLALNGTARLSFTREEGDIELNYGIAANRLFTELGYEFTYALTTRYVAGSGLEGSLTLREVTEAQEKKSASFILKDGYLYVDLSSFGIGKCKLAREELERRVEILGLTDTEEYTFKDKLRVAALLIGGVSREGDAVTCSFGKDLFDLLAKKLGFLGVFGVRGATLSWSVADHALSGLSAEISFPDAVLSFSDESFSFATLPEGAEISLPDDAEEYADLAENASTHLSLAGKISTQSAFASAGEMLSSLLSSLSGETLTFTVDSNELAYEAEFLFDKDGALDRAIVHLGKASVDVEVVKLYYTSEDPTAFYLIYPAVRTVHTAKRCVLADEPFAAFNAAMGLERDEPNKRIYLAASDDYFMFGANASVGSDLIALLSSIHSGLSSRAMDEMAFRRFEISLYAEKKVGTVVFDSRRSVSVTANSFAITHNDDFDLSVEVENIPAEIMLLDAEIGTMPSEARVTFPGKSAYKVSLLTAEGASTWTYNTAEVPRSVGVAASTVTAQVSLLGKTVTSSIVVDCTTPSQFRLLGSEKEEYAVGFYSPNNRTFTFARYGAYDPHDVIGSFKRAELTVLGDARRVEIASWNFKDTSTAGEKTEFDIEPRVKTFFGDEIEVGATLRLRFTGDKVVKTNYEQAFVAYDKQDPLDPETYPETIVALTEDDTPVTVSVVWDLRASEVVDAAADKALYRLSKTYTVHARVYDCWDKNSYASLPVSISFTPKILSVNYADFSFDMAELVGTTTYDTAKHTFLIDVLHAHSLSTTAWENVLPKVFTVENDNARFTMSGINWEFTEVASVENAVGTSGKVTLLVGDSVSGYQRKEFDYAFVPATVTKTELLDEDGGVIAESGESAASLYAYEIKDVNVFTYRYPAFIRVTYTSGGEEGKVYAYRANWSFDRDFKETEIANGGTYVGRSSVGSEPITVTFIFDKVLVAKSSFATDEAHEIAIAASETESGVALAGGKLAYNMNNGEMRLLFSVMGAMSYTVSYLEEKSYPSEILLSLNEETATPVSVKVDHWEGISAFREKKDVITRGFLDDVVAVVRGQRITVHVYVAPAIMSYDTVYTDESIAVAETVIFRLLTPDATSEDGYAVIDAGDQANYPDNLYIQSSGKTTRDTVIPIVRWEGYEQFRELYKEELKKGTPIERISGKKICTAVIGNDVVGYSNREIEVYLEASELQDLDVTGIPLSEEGTESITRIAGEGTHGTFSYAFSLEVNPYFVDPTSLYSYPRVITFKVDGQDASVKADWDLSEVPANAVKTGNSYTYQGYSGVYGFPVYARIDLGEAFGVTRAYLEEAFKKGGMPDMDIRIGVEVNIKARNIDKVYIKDRAGKYSTQSFIYVDSYAAYPFGKDVDENGNAYLDVKVTFAGDTRRYDLKLRYNTKGISLSYDGTGGKTNVTVDVGNESAGYQPIEGYTVSVIENVIEQINVPEAYKIASAPNTIFYQKKSLGDDRFEEIFNPMNETTLASNGLPTVLTVKSGGEERTVYEYRTEEAKDSGVVFEWIADNDGHMGIRLWNATVPETVRGEAQELYNEAQESGQLPASVSDLFDVLSYRATYGDTAETYITPANVLNAMASHFLTNEVEEKYQTRYIVRNGETTPLGENETLGAGDYRICVKAVGHALYNDTPVSIPFTVDPKDITSEVRLYCGNLQVDSGEEFSYNGAAGYVFTAKVQPKYHIQEGIDLLVKAEVGSPASSVTLSDVKYSGKKAVPYVITVTSGNPNYVVGTELSPKTFEVTICEILLADEKVSVTVVWSETHFVVTAYVQHLNGAVPKAADEDSLTHGYLISYYEKDPDDPSSLDTPVTEGFASGKTYAWQAFVKVENYWRVTKTGEITIP